uniref:Biogenesis of lysosome-related organelles complex 1 subunit 3 n=1 Tax=Latimeria chalumnae TaxID=7897 RepID=H3A4L4_LATCH
EAEGGRRRRRLGNPDVVVQGEASESDSEEEVYLTSTHPIPFSGSLGSKVPGEASETDEEEEERPRAASNAPKSLSLGLTPLVVIRTEQPGSPTGVEERPALKIGHGGRYSTLLEQKLLESNARLQQDVSNAVRQVYQTAARQIQASTLQLSNSQNGIINASHSIRLILDDLRAVAETMDIITSCNLLPDI